MAPNAHALREDRSAEEAGMSLAAVIYLLAAPWNKVTEAHTIESKHAQVRGRAA